MLKLVENFVTFTGVAKKALDVSLVLPSVNSKEVPTTVVLPFSCMFPAAEKPSTKLILGKLIVKSAVAIALAVHPFASAIALRVVVLLTLIAWV